MKLPLLALAVAISLAGCTGSESTSTTPSNNNSGGDSGTGGSGSSGGTGGGTGGGTTPSAPVAKLGIEGPADPVQQALSEQLFGALIEGAAPADEASPLPVKLAGVLTCVDNTVSLRALDLVDALAADGAAGPDTLTAPQNSQTLQAAQALVSAAGGLVGSLAGQSGCDLAGIPGLPGLPSGGGAPSDLPLSLDTLTQQAEAIRAISVQLRNAASQASAAPLVPEALELVADAVDDAVTVLQQGTNAAGYQTAVTNLVTNLAANLQALPAALTAGGLPSGIPGLPSGAPDAGANPLKPLTDLLAGIPGLNQLPLSALPLSGLPTGAPALPGAPGIPGADALSPAGLKAALSAIPGLGALLAMLPI